MKCYDICYLWARRGVTIACETLVETAKTAYRKDSHSATSISSKILLRFKNVSEIVRRFEHDTFLGNRTQGNIIFLKPIVQLGSDNFLFCMCTVTTVSTRYILKVKQIG